MVKISIIITEKNCKKYLKICLDSVLNQTYKNYEVIIVDDASEEKLENINDFAENIKYIYLEEGMGPGGARNIGLQQATGEYICFLDSDDWWDLSYLEQAVQILSVNKADIGMMGLVRNYDTQSIKPVYKCFYDRVYNMTGEIAFKIMTYQYDMGVKIIPAATNKFYKKSFLEKNKLIFLEKIYFEDLPFNFRAVRLAKMVTCIPNSFYHHYRRNGSIVQSFSEKNLNDLVTVFKQIRNDLKVENVYELYMLNYYKLLEHFYNLIIRQIFQFIYEDSKQKELINLSLKKLKSLIVVDEFLNYMSAEDLRKHIQPNCNDTTIY